jgi:GT2 family glycosyltransferase
VDDQHPKVTVIIPHWNGKDILHRCLVSLKKATKIKYKVLIVDNGSTDGSPHLIKEEFPDFDIIQNSENLGFAAGCNVGISHSQGPYVVLLNNDTVVTDHWLKSLVEVAEKDPTIAAVQPKLLSLSDPQFFDYSGAAGGQLDIFGYPFAWGRLFNTTEKDEGQYNEQRSVFWASGAAVLMRRSAIEKVGLLDSAFFAHMEEIDLNWRFHLAGYKIVYEPCSVVYHQTGATLSTLRFRKMVLNHRNSLLMILKNHSFITLLWVVPIRIILDLVSILGAIVRKEPKRALAVIAAFWGAIAHWSVIIKGRYQNQRVRIITDHEMMRKLYQGSVALEYFLNGVYRATDLRGIN